MSVGWKGKKEAIIVILYNFLSHRYSSIGWLLMVTLPVDSLILLSICFSCETGLEEFTWTKSDFRGQPITNLSSVADKENLLNAKTSIHGCYGWHQLLARIGVKLGT